MVHIRMGAVSTDKYSEVGQETVGIHDPVGTQIKVTNDDMQYDFATALLDQLEDYGTDVNEHCMRLMTRQYSAKSQIESKTFLEILSV